MMAKYRSPLDDVMARASRLRAAAPPPATPAGEIRDRTAPFPKSVFAPTPPPTPPPVPKPGPMEDLYERAYRLKPELQPPAPPELESRNHLSPALDGGRLIGGRVPAPQDMPPAKDPRVQTWFEATAGALAHGTAGIGASALNTLDRMSEIPEDAPDILFRGGTFAPARREGFPADTAEDRRAKDLIFYDASAWLTDFQDRHPNWRPTEVSSAADLLSNPKALVSNLAAMIPYMAGTTAAFLAGGPSAAGIFAYAIESDNAYQTAIASGATPAQARSVASVVGTVNAVIELAQVGHFLKFGKQAGRKALTRTLTAMTLAKGGGKLALTEALEEVLQGTTEDLAAYGIYDRPISRPCLAGWAAS